MNSDLPPWADYALLPFINLIAALALSGLVILAVGQDPLAALGVLVDGAIGSGEAIGFTLYYATTFMFTGLAVAIPFHAGLFNIGGEGQAMLGGIGVTFVCLALGGWPLWLVLPLALLAAVACGAAWAFHASTDGKWWRLLRYFALSGDPADLVRVGFLAQSPTGEGCAATFDHITFRPGAPKNLRDGS